MLAALIYLLTGCAFDGEERTVAMRFVKPTHFPEPRYTFENNPVNREGFELGKALFFDPMLSRDGSVACANCHIQAHAFADSWLHPFSVGVDDRVGTRNAPPLFNLAFQKEFFWDGGVTHLDFTPITAIESHVEMDERMENVVARLRAHPSYPERFKAAFGQETVTGPFVLHALSQYLLMLVSADSPYDRWVAGDQEALGSLELEGMALFRKHCESCHQEPLFHDQSYRNNGIQAEIKDAGRGRITERDADRGKFKVPSLRNVAVTAPYMHNASFQTLDQVLDHYSEGIHVHPNLDPIFAANLPGLSLTNEEKVAIKAFLHALTDESFLTNPEFIP
jgi:cytochrome c peroxidase